MMSPQDLIKIKSEVLCWGLKTSQAAEEIYITQHPSVHKRTGNAGIHILLGNKLVANAIYGERFCEKSPYHIEKQKGRYFLYKNKKPVCNFSIIKAPKWYLLRTKDGALMADIALQEGIDTLISGVWNNCCYFSNGTQCKFCILGDEKGVEWKKVSHLLETVKTALKENPNYFLHLTGGNTFTPDHGIKYYEKYVKAARIIQKDLPISLEVSPPDDLKYLESIVRSGTNGFSINIEVWDEERRQKICPGKSKIDRELYFDTWKRGVELLGKFKISSVMIVGLDKPESIEEGIKQMVKVGVKPVLLPFRPFDKCSLNDWPPPNPVETLKLWQIAGLELKKAKALRKEFIGCEHCGACTGEGDFLDI